MSATTMTYEPPAQTSASTRSPRLYRPELDILRFVAFLAVFFLHGVAFSPNGVLKSHPVLVQNITAFRSMGRFGLSLFFLLSSFLITTLLLLEQQKTGTVHLRSFYMRRILRIWPLYFCVLLTTFVLGLLWTPAYFSPAALLSFSFLSANWYLIGIGGKIIDSIAPLWSISVEEQFYLVWPSLVRRMSVAKIKAFSVLLCWASLLGIYLVARAGSNTGQLWLNSVSQSLFFALGALLALHFGLKEQQKSFAKAAAGVTLCLLTWYVAVRLGFTHEGTAAYVWPLTYSLGAIGAGALLWAFLHLPRVFLRNELVYLGRISYGLYVFHGLLLVVGHEILIKRFHLRHSWIFIIFAMTVASAAASYRFLEKPFLRLKGRFEFVQSRAV